VCVLKVEIRDVKGEHQKISVLCKKFRKFIFQQRIEDEEGPPYTQDYVHYIFDGLKYNLGAFNGNKLVGVIGGNIIEGVYSGNPIKIGNIGRVAVEPDYWDRDRNYWDSEGIKEKLIDEILEKLKLECDLIYAELLKKEEQEDIKYLNSLGFELIKGRKNSEALIKIVGRDGLDLLKNARKMNPLEYNAAKLIAGIKKAELEHGEILDASEKDYKTVIELLNNYSKIYPLARTWSDSSFIEMVNNVMKMNNWNFSEIKKNYPETEFGGHFKIWRDGDEILGAQLYYIYYVIMEKSPVPMAFWLFSVFKEDIEPDERKSFISTLVRSMKGKVAVINVELPYYANKDFENSGFMGDQRPVALLLKPISDRTENILQERIKNYYLDIIGYNI